MAKSFLIKTVCKVLGKALIYLKARDRLCNAEFISLPKNLKVGLEIFGEGRYLTLIKTGNSLKLIKKDSTHCDLKIEFKTRKAAKKVMLGQIGVRESFARHDILVYGNINVAVILVRLIERAEAYLFPRFITKKFIDRVDKEFNSFKLYWFILFNNAIKIDNQEPKFSPIKPHKKQENPPIIVERSSENKANDNQTNIGESNGDNSKIEGEVLNKPGYEYNEDLIKPISEGENE